MPFTFFQVKSYNDLAHFETAYVVKLHSVSNLTSPQPVRTCLIYTSVFCVFSPYIDSVSKINGGKNRFSLSHIQTEQQIKIIDGIRSSSLNFLGILVQLWCMVISKLWFLMY